MQKQRHFLSKIDKIKKIGLCSNCGEVKISIPPSKKATPRCSKRIYAWKKEYRKTHKEKRNRKTIIKYKDKDPFCQICSKICKTVYDHDHKTGLFRGWLCSQCNLILGLCYEEKEILNNCVKYLEKHKINI